MSFIVNISELDRFSYESEGFQDSPLRDVVSALGRKGLRFLNDSLVVFSLIDKELLESIEKIDIGELERDIEESTEDNEIQRAREEIMADILAQEDEKVKNKKSIKDCSDRLSTRNKISRLLNQSM